MVSPAASGAGYAHPHTTPMPSPSDSYWSGKNIKDLIIQGISVGVGIVAGAAFVAVAAVASAVTVVAYIALWAAMVATVVLVPIGTGVVSYNFLVTMVPWPIAALGAAIVWSTVFGLLFGKSA